MEMESFYATTFCTKTDFNYYNCYVYNMENFTVCKPKLGHLLI